MPPIDYITCEWFDLIDHCGHTVAFRPPPGVYRIEMNDGTIYVGKATDIHNRIHGSFRDGGALKDLGYTADQVRGVDWIEMPGATDADLFQMENQWIEYEGGIGNLANRINSPERGTRATVRPSA